MDKAESVENFSTDSALDFLEVIPIQSVPKINIQMDCRRKSEINVEAFI